MSAEVSRGADDEEIRDAARAGYAMGSSNDIEIDDDAEVSEADNGVWVAAWVWVKFEEEEEADGNDTATTRTTA